MYTMQKQQSDYQLDSRPLILFHLLRSSSVSPLRYLRPSEARSLKAKLSGKPLALSTRSNSII